ncbi:hypothetical protein CFU_1550 [Collimonas fungivorans Ter331]|uniref:Uncharacterized protein n=1 Tax=Collimonas fungivorans (strain Ter331) TaxID=1005048 RepID=G0AJT7_COLFT|nr:hypothetical protein CFU_1550 [Collimonas fungivorans Ter331]
MHRQQTSFTMSTPCFARATGAPVPDAGLPGNCTGAACG